MKKQRLQLWQFILVLIPLVALPVIMCLPFYSLDKNVVKNTMKDVVQSVKEDLKDSSSQYKDQILDSFDENMNEDKMEQAVEESLNGVDYDEAIQKSEKLLGIPLSSISGWELLNLKVDISTDELVNLLSKEGEGDSITKFFVNSFASSAVDKLNETINDSLFPIRLIAWILFIVCVILIVIWILTYILKWNKFAALPEIALYGGVEIYFAVQALWIAPGTIGKEVSTGFQGTLEKISDTVSQVTGQSDAMNLDELSGYGDIVGKFFAKIVKYYYENMISVGFRALFIIGIFTAAAAVVVMVFGKRANQVENRDDNWGDLIHVPRIRGIKGMYTGADINLENTAISVGRNPQMCQIVIENPQVNEKDFTVWYNMKQQLYFVEWNAKNGWFETPLPPGSPSEFEIQALQTGMTYQVRPGTRIWIAGGQEGFLLK